MFQDITISSGLLYKDLVNTSFLMIRRMCDLSWITLTFLNQSGLDLDFMTIRGGSKAWCVRGRVLRVKMASASRAVTFFFTLGQQQRISRLLFYIKYRIMTFEFNWTFQFD